MRTQTGLIGKLLIWSMPGEKLFLKFKKLKLHIDK